MAVLAVIAGCRVTEGAGSRVPISGCSVPYLPGQVTSRHNVATGAAQSEPSGHLTLSTGGRCTGAAW